MLSSIWQRHLSTVDASRVQEGIRIRSLFLHVMILMTTGGDRLNVPGHICTTRSMPSIEESVARAADTVALLRVLGLEGASLRDEAKSVASEV